MGTPEKGPKVRVLRSGLEDGILVDLRRRRVPFDYEPFYLKYYIKPPGNKAFCADCGSTNVLIERNYLPDFVSKNGKIVVEAKGRFTSKDRTKMEKVVDQNKDVKIYMLFPSDNWITKNKKKRYSDWCRQKGISFYIGKVFPPELIKEFRDNAKT